MEIKEYVKAGLSIIAIIMNILLWIYVFRKIKYSIKWDWHSKDWIWAPYALLTKVFYDYWKRRFRESKLYCCVQAILYLSIWFSIVFILFTYINFSYYLKEILYYFTFRPEEYKGLQHDYFHNWVKFMGKMALMLFGIYVMMISFFFFFLTPFIQISFKLEQLFDPLNRFLYKLYMGRFPKVFIIIFESVFTTLKILLILLTVPAILILLLMLGSGNE